MNNEKQPLLDVRQLVKRYVAGGGAWYRKRQIYAVNGVDLCVFEGETLGLVGESGCGKSTLGRCILRLEEPSSGEVHVFGQDVLQLGRAALRRFRRQAQMIFQDPRGSLNPKMRIGEIVTEGLVIHDLITSRQVADEAARLLQRVGLDADARDRYPHQFSGGQRQRIGIARALALNPKLVIADEPTSALDVSVQAQIVNLLLDLQQELGLTYLFITHDLRLVRFFANRIAVMFYGKIVELAPTEQLFERPRHPYTRALLAATPSPDPEARRLALVSTTSGESRAADGPCCAYVNRCPAAADRCRAEAPHLRAIDDSHVACHFPLDAVPE